MPNANSNCNEKEKSTTMDRGEQNTEKPKHKRTKEIMQNKKEQERLRECNNTKKIEQLCNWLNNEKIPRKEKYFEVCSGHIKLDKQEQLILRFINPDLATFPRGVEIEVKDGKLLTIYHSINRYGV